jgi:hypothetical protein
LRFFQEVGYLPGVGVVVNTQAGAARAVNRHLTLRNWFIGAYIVEFEQNGEDRASYGQELLPRLAGDLPPLNEAGFSPVRCGIRNNSCASDAD